MSYQPPSNKKSNTGLWIGGATILLVALSAVAVLLLSGQPGTTAPTRAVIVSAATAASAPTDTPQVVDSPTSAPTETPTGTPLPELGTSNAFIEYILDASGSMTEALSDGSPKIEVAQRVLTEHMRSFRPETNIGLRVYGHRLPYQQEAESCQDIELIAPVEKGQMERIVGFLRDFTVQGMTPLASSLERAKDDFVYDASRVNSIVMLSDGIETCGGDPCQLVEDLKAQGINFTIHVIGLDVDEPTREQLSCIAQAGGGTYHDAMNQQDLGNALSAIKYEVTRDEVVTPAGDESSSAPDDRVPEEPLGVQPDVLPSSFLGSWRGSATQTVPDSQWTILMTLVPAQVGEIAGHIAYPSIRCGGQLTLQSVSSTSIELFEDITYGHCADLGVVRLTIEEPGLSYYWDKRDFPGVASGAVTNIGTAPVSHPSPFTGVWTGKTTEGRDWTILLGLHDGAVGSLVGTIAYPSLSCGGELKLTQLTANSMEFAQDITFGSCVDDLIVELTMQPDGTLHYSERYPDGRVSGSGPLRRISTAQ